MQQIYEVDSETKTIVTTTSLLTRVYKSLDQQLLLYLGNIAPNDLIHPRVRVKLDQEQHGGNQTAAAVLDSCAVLCGTEYEYKFRV